MINFIYFLFTKYKISYILLLNINKEENMFNLISENKIDLDFIFISKRSCTTKQTKKFNKELSESMEKFARESRQEQARSMEIIIKDDLDGRRF